MNVEAIVAALLNNAAITALVGNRRALTQLPQNTPMPALVYSVVDIIPQPDLAADGSQLARARVQINPLAGTVAEVKQIAAAVRSVMDFKHYIVAAGKTVVSSRIAIVDSMDKDNESGIWTQATDYIIMYYE